MDVYKYFKAWTVEGIHEGHEDLNFCLEWLKDKDLWTEEDETNFKDFDKEDFEDLAREIVELVKEEKRK